MMSSKSPAIKFSPFEALFIGEKNKILKRQPGKNTIFVSKIHQENKKFNLRDLFDIEKNDIKSENEEGVIFKMPQRVRDFLKTRKLNNKSCKSKIDNIYFKVKKQKIFIKNNEVQKTKSKSLKNKCNKVKFKKSLFYNEKKSIYKSI